MRLVQYRDPFREMERMLDTVRGQLVDNAEWQHVGFPINLRETDTDVMVEAHIPGIKADDLDVTYQDHILTISADTRTENEDDGDGWHVREIRQGYVRRSIRLPAEVEADNINADLENGVLTVTLPKAEASKMKRIAVNAKKLLKDS